MSSIDAKYMAVDINGQPFAVPYGLHDGEVKTTANLSDLASFIAYYWNRCYAKLKVKSTNGSWRSASRASQAKFEKLLDVEFFFQEMK